MSNIYDIHQKKQTESTHDSTEPLKYVFYPALFLFGFLLIGFLVIARNDYIKTFNIKLEGNLLEELKKAGNYQLKRTSSLHTFSFLSSNEPGYSRAIALKKY